MNSNNWYHSHSFNFRGLTWEFTYIEATASRIIEATKPDGTKIHLKIPIKETTKFAYPLAWLESKGKRILLREKAEPRTLFEMELTPSKPPQGETEKLLLGVNGNEPASMEELTPSNLQQGETEKTLLGVNGNKQEMQLTPSKSPHDETEKTLLGVNGNEPASMEELTPSNLQQGETEKTLLGVNENKQEMQLTLSKPPQGETEKTLLGVNENKQEMQLTLSKPPQGETEKTLLGVNENKQEMQLTPSKCLSCSFCQRISSILLTCLASPKYFTEETAKECERFTPIASKPEGNLEATKRPRRRRGTGSGTFITTYANHGKYGKKYPQISYQVEFGGKKRSIYVIAEKIEQVQELDRLGKPISEILEAIDSPKARKTLKEYKDFLESKEEKN